MNRLKTLLLLLGCLVQSCTPLNHGARHASIELSDIEQAKAMVGPEWPLDTATRLTTAGDIYLANLDSQIDTLEQRMSRRPDDQSRVFLALSRYHRFQIVGNLEDAEQARALLREAEESDHDQVVDLAYAQVLLGFHAFDSARTAVDLGRRNGAQKDASDALQQAINRATGTDNSGGEAQRSAADNAMEPVAQVTEAAELLERGQTAAASRLLKSAQDNYQDTSPYLLAWIYVQQGILFLRYQDYDTAVVFFSAAHERFPQYALATEHLAEAQLALGNNDSAAELYRSVAAETGNPEFYYRLAKAEHALGNEDETQRQALRAASGYADLMQRYPLMYADHAARYYMDVGNVDRAWELAQTNIQARRDIRARMLLLEASILTGRSAAACAELTQIQALGFAPPELPRLTNALAGACGAAG